MKIRIIQQETGTGTGVQQHAQRPDTEKTFCGVRYNERERWFDYEDDEDVEIEKDSKRFHVTCMTCRKGIKKLLLRKEEVTRKALDIYKLLHVDAGKFADKVIACKDKEILKRLNEIQTTRCVAE